MPTARRRACWPGCASCGSNRAACLSESCRSGTAPDLALRAGHRFLLSGNAVKAGKGVGDAAAIR